MPPIWLFWIVGTLIVTLVAGLFILTALFPRRTGQTPFCRKCRYNLTGLEHFTFGWVCVLGR